MDCCDIKAQRRSQSTSISGDFTEETFRESTDAIQEYDSSISGSSSCSNDSSYNRKLSHPEQGFLCSNQTLANGNSTVGSIAIQSSSDVTIGDRNYFNGPVVINRYAENGSTKIEKEIIIVDDATKARHFWNKKRNIFICGSATFVALVICVILTTTVFNKQSFNNNVITDDEQGMLITSAISTILHHVNFLSDCFNPL